MHFFHPSQHRNASMALASLSHAVQLSHSTPTGHVTQTGSLSHTHTHANSHISNSIHISLLLFFCILKINIPEGMWATFLWFNGKSFFFVPNASWSHQNSVLLAQSCREEWEESWSSVFVFWSFLPCVIRKGSTLRRWISLPVWPFFFFFFELKTVGAHLWSAPFSDGCFPPKLGISYRGLSLHGSVDWASASQGRL